GGRVDATDGYRLPRDHRRLPGWRARVGEQRERALRDTLAEEVADGPARRRLAPENDRRVRWRVTLSGAEDRAVGGPLPLHGVSKRVRVRQHALSLRPRDEVDRLAVGRCLY